MYIYIYICIRDIGLDAPIQPITVCAMLRGSAHRKHHLAEVCGLRRRAAPRCFATCCLRSPRMSNHRSRFVPKLRFARPCD